MSRLFIAEKPELARAIVAGMNGTEQTFQGYIKKGDDYVSWSYGHILALKEPDELNPSYTKWNLADLPLNLSFKYKPVPKSSAQLKNIINLINNPQISQIIHCGDADEEGQILIDEILAYAQNQKPVGRMLINDITPKAIQKELNNIRPNSEFKHISNSGFARSRADYVVGMNLTRAYTLNYQRQNNDFTTFTIGRVQTPILALIVNRDLENDNFKSIDYFEINANFNFNDENLAKTPFTLKTDEKILDLNVAQSLAAQIKNANFTLSKNLTQKIENPPLPYNLLNLQSEASKIYGFSAKKTLQITQDLREKHKAISYNRSDCEYIPTSIYEQKDELISVLNSNFSDGKIDFSNINPNLKSKAFDDSKITAHYAIIPTTTKLNLADLSADELKIYTLITKRFLLQFCESREYNSYKITLSSNDFVFEKTFNFTTKLGFKAFLGKSEEDEPEISIDLSNLSADSVTNGVINKKQTKPHPRYTMTTLLKDLNSVAKYVKDERIKKLLLEKDKDKKGESGGIGTPATRADMIEKLEKTEYITISKDKKQSITSTPKGKKLIECVSDLYKNPDMTALWFEMQKEIMSGNLSIDEFLSSVQNTINDEIEKIKNGDIKMQGNKEIYNCPWCEDGILRIIKGKNGNFYGCSNFSSGCKFTTQITKDGKPDFEKKEQIPKADNQTTNYDCPKCKKGKLIKRPSKKDSTKFWYGCSEWKNGCNFSCFEKDGQPNFESSK